MTYPPGYRRTINSKGLKRLIERLRSGKRVLGEVVEL